LSIDLDSLSRDNLRDLKDDEFKELVSNLISLQSEDLKENQILYYRPVSTMAEKVHLSSAKTIAIGGGNGSSKTETVLAEIVMCATGITPLALQGKFDPKKKFRGPINVRVVCESLTTVLHPIMLPKLQWWKWSGVDAPGGKRGHWGWIPKTSLVDGSWDKSWSEKTRLLRLLYRDPENPEVIVGESTIQFMSHDQDPSDFASGDFHMVLHDEMPKYATWRENQARTMRVNGRNFLAMTWPDEPAIPVDWVFDEVYDKAQPGPARDPAVEWYNLYTTDNLNLDQEAVAKQAAQWSDAIRRVRIFGQPIRFSNRIHPLFTDVTQQWCFRCVDTILSQQSTCPVCGSQDVTTFNHVKLFDPQPTWPTIFLLDPHPRKPHMFLWAQVDTFDDIWVVAEGAVDGDPVDVKRFTDQVERQMTLHVQLRLIDPNMGASPSGAKRGVTWADEFAHANLRCDLADDSDVGRARVNEYLRPDPRRLQPRLHVREGCFQTIQHMKRYAWDEYRAALEKDLKQKPKEKYDDYPTLLKYLMNFDPSFQMLTRGAPIIQRPGHRRGAYG
jgi:hypothetical protein